MPGRLQATSERKKLIGSRWAKQTAQAKRLRKLPPCPPYLEAEASDFWHDTGIKLVKVGILTTLDLDSFAALCEAHQMRKIAFRKLLDDGVCADGGREGTKRSP